MYRVAATAVFRALPALLLVLVLSGSAFSPLHAAGFSIFEQGSKAMGMAGAFTAQADDPSALFHNVGGLAFFQEREFAAGMTLITSSGAEFQGAPPLAGITASSRSFTEFPPHFYWVEPLGGRWSFGLAVNAPFGLSTEWDADRFPGRFISSKAVLTALDINPNFGYRVSDQFGVGFGLIARVSEVELNRSQATINPFTALPVEIAKVSLMSDMETGTGWQVGFLHRVNESFSWGASYRSALETDFGGDARLTQVSSGNPAFDAAVAASLPFDQDLPITTTLEYPDTLSIGVAVALNRIWLVEVDANRTGWSDFDRVEIDFSTAPALNTALTPRWEDADHLRIGFRRQNRGNTEWRFGVVFDDSPQPDENVGPLLPDADREGVTIGWGWQGDRRTLDLALMFLPFDERTTRVNEDNFNGTYDTTAWLFGVTVGW